MKIVRIRRRGFDTTTMVRKTPRTSSLTIKQLFYRAREFVLESDDLLDWDAVKDMQVADYLGLIVTEVPLDGRSKQAKELEYFCVWDLIAFAKKKRFIVKYADFAPNLYAVYDSKTKRDVAMHAFRANMEKLADKLNNE